MIGVLSTKYQTQTRGAVDLNVLQACIGEKIKIITEIYFDDIYTCYDDQDKIAYFGPDSGLVDTRYTNDLIYFSDAGFLNNAQVGDLFSFTNVDGTGPDSYFTFTLLEKVNENVGRFDLDFQTIFPGIPGEPAYCFERNQFFANITSLKSLIYQFGINETGGFVSQIDGSLHKFSISSASHLTDNTGETLLPYGDLDWQIDTVELLGLDYDPNFPTDTRPRIRITHNTVVTPLFLDGQYSNLQQGIAPDYFKPDNQIKYTGQIDWNKSNSFIDNAKRIILDPVGQFGWFGTRFDGAKPDYSITSLTIQRISDSEFINQLEYNEVEVIFNVHSVSGSFDPTDSALIFGFNYLPQDSSLYQNTNRSIATNFCFDSKKINPDNISINGDYFGTSKQVIKTIKGDVIDANNTSVTVRILFGSGQADILTQEDTANYAMWVICENTAVDVELSDKSNILIQVDTIHVQLTKTDLLTDNTKFIEHPYDIAAAGFETLEMFPVDDVVANSSFGLNYTGLEDDGILLKTCTPKIVISHATEADITLDSFTINLENFQTVGSLPAVQAIDFNQIRPYKIENGIRKFISLERDFLKDDGLTKYFALNFPFMNRWEYWLQIAGLVSIPESLFDPSQDFNGANHLWNRLANASGWTLKYVVTFQIIQNGKLFEQEFEYELTSTYFESNTDWNNCNIKTYDVVTDSEIIVGSKKYANSNSDTKIICSFEKTIGDVPENASAVAIVIWAEGFEGGGVPEITRIDSVVDVTEVSLFKSIDESNKVKVTKTGSVFTGEALLRSDKIQNRSKLTLYARIYEVQVIDDSERVTNDFILRITNDLQARLVL